MFAHKKIEIYCAQWTQWKGTSARLISGKNSQFRCSRVGINDRFDGMTIPIESKCIQNVISVNRINNRLIDIWILTNKSILKIVNVYAHRLAIH